MYIGEALKWCQYVPQIVASTSKTKSKVIEAFNLHKSRRIKSENETSFICIMVWEAVATTKGVHALALSEISEKNIDKKRIQEQTRLTEILIYWICNNAILQGNND